VALGFVFQDLLEKKRLENHPDGVIAWQLIGTFAESIILFGIVALLITSVLGLMAMGQIRRSRSRLYGLRLALGDTLLFPLLALDFWMLRVLWFSLGSSIGHWFEQHHLPDVWHNLFRWCFLALVIVACGAVDLWIARAAWRKVRC
jgi:hypothetical protein